MKTFHTHTTYLCHHHNNSKCVFYFVQTFFDDKIELTRFEVHTLGPNEQISETLFDGEHRPTTANNKR